MYLDLLNIPMIEPLNITTAIGWSKKSMQKKIDLKSVGNSEGVISVVTFMDIPGRNDVGPVFDGDPIFQEQSRVLWSTTFAVAATSTVLARKAY